MSMSFIEFESSRKKDAQRQFEREAREAILEKAKNKYEADQRRQEEARQRGEHTWMLPSVESRLHSDKSKKKKKKGKKKKKKKDKKAKKSKKNDSSSSDSESEEDEGKWVERATPQSSSGVGESSTKFASKQPTPTPLVSQTTPNSTEKHVKRDGWMEMTSLFGTYSREQLRERDGTSRIKEKEEKERKKRESEKPGSHARELNPYFRDGGTGLPEETGNGAGAGAGPGMDAAWLRRAMRRAQEQAEQEKKPLAEIAAQRWGSLEKFNELLAQAEERGRKYEGKWQRKESVTKRRSRSREQHIEDKRENRNIGNDEENSNKKGNRDIYIKPCDRKDTRKFQSRSREQISQDRRSRSKKRKYRRHSSSNSSSSSSRSRSRSRSRERWRSRDSRSRSKDRRRQMRHSSNSSSSRSKSRERRRSRDSRSRSKDRRRQRRHSSSSSSSGSRSRKRSKADNRNDDNHERSSRVQRFMKPQDDFEPTLKQSSLASKFLKPGKREASSRCVPSVVSREPSKSQRGWQKQEYQEPPEPQPHRMQESESSSSESSSESEDEAKAEENSGSQNNLESMDKVGSTSANGSGAGGGRETSKQPLGPLLNDKEMNELAAKIMKAELIGNETQASKLKVKLEAARATRASSSGGGDKPGEGEGEVTEQVVVLTRMDNKGICRPVIGEGEERAGRRKKTKGSITHNKDGQRDRYFPDDDSHDLKSMFEREKGTTAEDQNEMFEDIARAAGEKLDEEYDLDDMFMSKVATRDTAAKQAERDRLKAIQEHKRAERSLESCQWCFDNKEMPKHLIVALGTKCYVCLPPHQSLTTGHCLILPIHHVPCAVQADEDLWAEVQTFRKSLVKMYNSRDEDCVFFETAKRLRHFPHMAISCVPMPREVGDMAPIYFKKAILECEHEWAQNKKLVDLKERNVRSAVPKGLPYFFVDFGMQAGYAHVIEDEQDFPNNFAQEIVGGMLDLENNLWRKPRRENFDLQRKKVMEFSRCYKDFDPTQQDKD